LDAGGQVVVLIFGIGAELAFLRGHGGLSILPGFPAGCGFFGPLSKARSVQNSDGLGGALGALFSVEGQGLNL
jgi:hypothetical protein